MQKSNMYINNDLKEKMEENYIKFNNFLTNKLFKNLKKIDNIKNETYEMKCPICNNDNIIISSIYVLHRCNKCNKDYIPKLK